MYLRRQIVFLDVDLGAIGSKLCRRDHFGDIRRTSGIDLVGRRVLPLDRAPFGATHLVFWEQDGDGLEHLHQEHDVFCSIEEGGRAMEHRLAPLQTKIPPAWGVTTVRQSRGHHLDV